MTPNLFFKIDQAKYPQISKSHQLPNHLKRLALPACRILTTQQCPVGFIIRQDLHNPVDYQIFTNDFIFTQQIDLQVEISAPLVLMLMTLQGRLSITVPGYGWQTIEKNYYNLFHIPAGFLKATCYTGETRVFCFCMSPDYFNKHTTGMDEFFVSQMRQALKN